MTPIDFGTNPADAVGLPGINLNPATSAMTQLAFQNIRNLGANSNQPLITNQNDFQIFDNVTWIKGKHTVKMGGSITLRSREILNADTIVGNFSFNNNMTSNCAGQPAGCTINTTTGFDVASFMLGFVNVKGRNLFDAATYTETRPEYARLRAGRLPPHQPLTMNLGLRWDVYPPWIEVDNRQSNFDEATGKFVVASDDAVVNGVKVGRYLQTYSKGDLGPRLGFAYDLDGSGKTLVRGGFGVFWNFTPGGTSSSKAQNPPFLQSTTINANPTAYGVNNLLRTGLPDPPGVDPNRPASGTTRSIFDVNFRDAYARQWNLNVQRQLFTNYMLEVAYVGSQGRNMLVKGDPNQARPVVGVTDSNVNRPYAQVSPALRSVGQVQARGTLDYNALLVKFQRRFANNFSMLNWYTYGKAIDLNSDNDGARHADERLRSAVQPRAGGLRHHAHVHVERDLRDSVGQGQAVRRMAAGRNRARPRRTPAHGDHHDRRAVDRHRQSAEPDLRRPAERPDDRPLVRHVVLRSADRHDRHLRRFRPRHHPRARLVQHRCLADQEHEDRPVHDRVPPRGVQRAEPPAVRQPEHDRRERPVRDHLDHAVQPVLLALRNGRTTSTAGGQGTVLTPSVGSRRPLSRQSAATQSAVGGRQSGVTVGSHSRQSAVTLTADRRLRLLTVDRD